MFWRSKDLDEEQGKDPLIYGDVIDDDDGDYNWRLWMDYNKPKNLFIDKERVGFHTVPVGDSIKPTSIHTEHGDSTLRVVSHSEHEPTKLDMFSPSTRIANYFNSLSQKQCSKLIGKLGKLLDES